VSPKTTPIALPMIVLQVLARLMIALFISLHNLANRHCRASTACSTFLRNPASDVALLAINRLSLTTGQ
jgi:hypothetical protein